MMKHYDTVKEVEIEPAEALGRLLENVPALEILSVKGESILAPNNVIDATLTVSHGDRRYKLIVEVKVNGQPRYVRNAIYQLRNYVAHYSQKRHDNEYQHAIPVLVSRYLSPEARSICDKEGVAYLDLLGNTKLVFNGVYIERSVSEKPKSESRALRSIFSPKASQILRAMFREPERVWRVTDLSEQANVSLGHVSNVRKALLEREWAEERKDGVVLTHPNVLLDSWRENYRKPYSQKITGYTHLHGSVLEEHLRGVLNPFPDKPRVIAALHAAAKWFAPFGRGSSQSFYADELGAKKLKDALELAPASKGPNVIIYALKDDGIFQDAVGPAEGIFCTSIVQTYLDLWNGNDRDREAAEFLREERLQWLQ